MAKVKSERAMKQGESICEQWNYHWPAGTQVTLIDDDGNPILTETTSEAWPLGHGEPVVKVRGKSGGYMLSRLIPSNPHRPTLTQPQLRQVAPDKRRAGKMMADYRGLVMRAVSQLKHIGPFRHRPGHDPHPLDCTLAGRVSHVFGIGMSAAIGLCTTAGQDPEFQEDQDGGEITGRRR